MQIAACKPRPAYSASTKLPANSVVSHAILQNLRVFISYPRGGRAHSLARQVDAELTRSGATVFFDEHSLTPGSSRLSVQIEQGIAQAQVVLFLLGADTRKCDWQEREARHAQDRQVPIVVAQTSAVTLPVYVGDAVPVSASGLLAQWLPRVIEALQREARQPDALSTQAALEADALAIQLDEVLRRYLDDRLAREFSDRTERYVPLAGQRRESHSPHKGRKNLRFAPRMEHRAPAECGGYGEPVSYNDVLTAYQHLPADRQPRLAVLGEPGAGKSFSLERLFCALAEALLEQPLNSTLPVPLLLRLGDWTRASETLEDFLADHLREHGSALLAQHWPELRRQRPLVLLLDAYNEIPVGQRLHKSAQVQDMAGDTRWAAVIVSCRERDFTQELVLPFDTLTLQPLTPPQVLEYLERWHRVNHDPVTARDQAEAQFWRLAAGNKAGEAQAVWRKWQLTGASFELFWLADEVPWEEPIARQATLSENQIRQHLRHNPRGLLRLVCSPFWLSILVERNLIERAISGNRATLINEVLRTAHADGERLYGNRQSLDSVPDIEVWTSALQSLALVLQRGETIRQIGVLNGIDLHAGTQTRVHRSLAQQFMSDEMLEFSISVQVLNEIGGQVHFHHQLLQEALAARALLAQCDAHPHGAQAYWPATHWWKRAGWEVVIELASESVGEDIASACKLVAWLAEAQPEIALQVWRSLGQPQLPELLRERIRQAWLPDMTAPAKWPRPEARAAIGRALAGFDLDNRPGIGLRPDGLPDIGWVEFNDGQPFIYQRTVHAGLPPFAMSRYLVTHRQFQTFVDAHDGYADQRWWYGFEGHLAQIPPSAHWPDSNCPRETVSWYEAVAFCRWLSHRLRLSISLPSEVQWERAACGRLGWQYPNGTNDYMFGYANCYENPQEGGSHLQRTSAVGLYPQSATTEGSLLDMAGNVMEWCTDLYDATKADGLRMLRGGAWSRTPGDLRGTSRLLYSLPENRSDAIGFRVCRTSPI